MVFYQNLERIMLLYYFSNLNKLKSCLLQIYRKHPFVLNFLYIFHTLANQDKFYIYIHQIVSRIVVAGASTRQPAPECDSFMDGDAVGTWRGKTATLGRHGGNLMVDLAQTLFSSVPIGWPIISRWKHPLVKSRLMKVKGVDLRVNWSRDRPVGGLRRVAMPPEHYDGSSYMF